MTDLIEVKTADLAGEALGWAVGIAEGLDLILIPPEYGNPWRVFARYQGQAIGHIKRYNPWEDWAVGGPLMQKHNVSLHCPLPDWDYWTAWITHNGKDVAQGAELPLPATCRAIVAHKLGSTVQFPNRLCPKQEKLSLRSSCFGRMRTPGRACRPTDSSSPDLRHR